MRTTILAWALVCLATSAFAPSDCEKKWDARLLRQRLSRRAGASRNCRSQEIRASESASRSSPHV